MKSKAKDDAGLLRRFFRLTQPYQPPLRMVYVMYLLNSLLNLVPAASLRYYFDMIVSPKPVSFFGLTIDMTARMQTTSAQITASFIYFAGVVLVIVVANIVGVYMWRLGTRVSQQVILDIKLRIHHHLHKLSMSFFDRERTGEIMSRAVSDVEQIEHMVRQSFSLFYGFIHLLAVPVIMIGMSPWLFLASLIPTPIIIWTVSRIRRRLRPLYRQMREQQADIGAALQEHISGMREIKAFSQEPAARRTYMRANLAYVRAVNRAMRVFSLNHQILYGTRDFAMILIGVGGGMLVFLGFESVSLGMIISFLPLLTRFLDPIAAMVNFYDVIQRGLASAERIFGFLDIQPEVQDEPHAPYIPLRVGEVAFENVTFGYDPERPVLNDVHFHVDAGKKVALVGGTGSGKSTLISLLLRFYEPQTGRILIDGHDISKIKYDSISHAIGIVFQETFLFYGSIAENIGFSNQNASRDQIREAARLANIDEFIESLPEAYDTPVGERGITLSGGQRQRIAIARMILKNPPIIVLDEATSAVDTHTEKSIQDSLDWLTRDRTTFVIAHRLSTIRNADTILVLDHGRIVETGAHEELLNNNGTYADLVRHSAL